MIFRIKCFFFRARLKIALWLMEDMEDDWPYDTLHSVTMRNIHEAIRYNTPK